jgi:hypothetical protein
VQSRLPPVDPVELETLKTLNLTNKANAQRVYNFLKGRRMIDRYNVASNETKDTLPPPFIYDIIETANYITDKGLIYDIANKDKPLSERQSLMSEFMKNHGDDANIRELFNNIFTISLNADLAGSHAPQEIFTEINPKFIEELFNNYLRDRDTYDNETIQERRRVNKLDPNKNTSSGDVQEQVIENSIDPTNPTLGGPVIPQPAPEDEGDSARRNAEESADREYQRDKDAVKEKERLKDEPEVEPEVTPEESQETIESITPKKKEPSPADITIVKFSKAPIKPEELKAGDYIAFSLYRSSNKKLSNIIGKDEDVSLMRVIEMKGDTVYVASQPFEFKSKAMKDKKLTPNIHDPEYRYYDYAHKNNLLRENEFIYKIDRRSDFFKYWPNNRGTERVKMEYVAVHTRPIPQDAIVSPDHASPRTPTQKKTEEIPPPVPESDLPPPIITTGKGFDSGYAGGNIRYYGSGSSYRGGASGYDSIRKVFYPLNVNNLGPFIVLNNVTTNLWRIDI